MTAPLVAPSRPSGARPAVRVRAATHADNAALVALTLACPMRGDVSLVSDRSPDFFALNRLEGDRWEVLVAEDASDRVVGCVAVAERRVWLRGEVRRSLYVSDLKVHPDWRGGPVADRLERAVRDACARLAGDDAPVLITVLAGNAAMLRRMPGPRGLPALTHAGTIVASSIPLLWAREPARRATPYAIRRATRHDLSEMAEVWERAARARNWMPAHDAASLDRCIARAPGVGIGDVRLAVGPDDRIAGWAVAWNQQAFKRTRVVAWSHRLRAARAVCNALAPLVGAVPLPDAGAPLPSATLAMIAVPPTHPQALRALVLDAYAALRGRVAFLTVGLDARDPLRIALRGLMAQPTRIEAFVTTPSGRWPTGLTDDRPLYHDIALV